MIQLPDNCEIFITQDGTPTLQWKRADGYGEKMHHSGGALSESLFIYRDALRELLERQWPARIVSLGLGLAYNEMIAIGELHKVGIESWKVWSFESEDFLRSGFSLWLSGDDAAGAMAPLYDNVLNAVATSLELPAIELKKAVCTALTNGNLELRGRFPQHSEGVHSASCLFYDAFSNKMDSALWDQTAMETVLRQIAAPQCVLTTYASTGSMKRALKTLGFRLISRPGFLGKRERTLAIREEIR